MNDKQAKRGASFGYLSLTSEQGNRNPHAIKASPPWKLMIMDVVPKKGIKRKEEIKAELVCVIIFAMVEKTEAGIPLYKATLLYNCVYVWAHFL